MTSFTLKIENTGNDPEEVILFERRDAKNFGNPDAIKIALIDIQGAPLDITSEDYGSFIEALATKSLPISAIFASKAGMYTYTETQYIGNAKSTPLHIVPKEAEAKRILALWKDIEINSITALWPNDPVKPGETLLLRFESGGEPIKSDNSPAPYIIVIENTGDTPSGFALFDDAVKPNFGNPPGISIYYGYKAHTYGAFLNTIRNMPVTLSAIFCDKGLPFILKNKPHRPIVNETIPANIYPNRDKEFAPGIQAVIINSDVIMVPDGWELAPGERIEVWIEPIEPRKGITIDEAMEIQTSQKTPKTGKATRVSYKTASTDFILSRLAKELMYPFALTEDVIANYMETFANTPLAEKIQAVAAVHKFQRLAFATGEESIPLILSVENKTDKAISVDLFADRHSDGVVVEQLKKDTNNFIDYPNLIMGNDLWKYVIRVIRIELESGDINTLAVSCIKSISMSNIGDATIEQVSMAHNIYLDQSDLSYVETRCNFILMKDYSANATTEVLNTIQANTKVVFKLFPTSKLKRIWPE